MGCVRLHSLCIEKKRFLLTTLNRTVNSRILTMEQLKLKDSRILKRQSKQEFNDNARLFDNVDYGRTVACVWFPTTYFRNLCYFTVLLK